MNNTSIIHETPSSSNTSLFENPALTPWYILVLTFSVVFGPATHGYVLWLIFSRTKKGLASEFFILNLSISEFLFSIFTAGYLCFVIQPRLRELGYMDVLKFFTGNFITVRPLFQCVICFERYLAVVHPVTFLKCKPLRYRILSCTIVWILGLISCLFCLFILVQSYFMWFCFLQFLVFFSVQLFCLVAVLRALKRSGPGEGSRGREEEDRKKKRAFNIIIIMTVTMFMFIFPFLLSRFINILLDRDVEEFGLFCLLCFILGGFVPALLYLRRVGKLSFIR